MTTVRQARLCIYRRIAISTAFERARHRVRISGDHPEQLGSISGVEAMGQLA
jgi:hypothetical protein